MSVTRCGILSCNMLIHETFLKHYLPRRITADTQATVRRLEPQQDIMRAVCRTSRSIDPRRPRTLTSYQSCLVNSHPRVRNLVKLRDLLKEQLGGQATQNTEYQAIGRALTNERQRRR